MRKLEARLEKVADEKWSEDPATEDEEAAVGLSPYTCSLMNLPPPRPSSPSLCWENTMCLPGSSLCPPCFAFFLPRPWSPIY